MINQQFLSRRVPRVLHAADAIPADNLFQTMCSCVDQRYLLLDGGVVEINS